jgi:hypothetical protein
LVASESFVAELVRRTVGADDDDAGGGVIDTGGIAAAAVGLDEALPSGFCVKDTNAKAAAPSTMDPMSAAESHFLAGLALAGCAAP